MAENQFENAGLNRAHEISGWQRPDFLG